MPNIEPAFAGIDFSHFSPEEQAQLRRIHKRVVRDRVSMELKKESNRMDEIVEGNLVLRRLLLALRTQTEPTRDNVSLLGQIDARLRYSEHG